MFTLAHLSDPHLAGWPAPPIYRLFSKRFVGMLSWGLRRRRVHLTPILQALIADLEGSRPEHTVITGDIVNIALPVEFERATRWLASIGDPEILTVIPGNHDAYVEVPWDRTIGQWSSWMRDDMRSPPTAPTGPDDFPFVRIRERIALIGVSSAAPMPIISAGGRVGPAQLDRLRNRLEELRTRDLCRIVLIHHPPFEDRRHRRKELEDSAALRTVIAEAGAELVLHGHTHRSSLGHIDSVRGAVPVIGVASASARKWSTKDPARYHLYRIDKSDKAWKIEVEVRSLTPRRDAFETSNRFLLTVPLADSPEPHLAAAE